MSEHYVTIVDIETSLDNARAQAQHLLAWLQAEGIISEGIREGEIYRKWLLSIGATDSAPSKIVEQKKIVYPPGPNVSKACSPEANLATTVTNWLEIDIKRQVFDAGENGLGIFCPACGSDQREHYEAWGNAMSEWLEGSSGAFDCADCSSVAPLQQWRFDPVWAFGNLGFRFYNWVLEPDFVAEFAKRLGTAHKVVHTHR
jgi:hypothetical protein